MHFTAVTQLAGNPWTLILHYNIERHFSDNSNLRCKETVYFEVLKSWPRSLVAEWHRGRVAAYKVPFNLLSWQCDHVAVWVLLFYWLHFIHIILSIFRTGVSKNNNIYLWAMIDHRRWSKKSFTDWTKLKILLRPSRSNVKFIPHVVQTISFGLRPNH